MAAEIPCKTKLWHMKEFLLTVSRRILRKKSTHKKTFFSMMARVWERGTYRKKSLCCQLFIHLKFFPLFLQYPSRISCPKPNSIFHVCLLKVSQSSDYKFQQFTGQPRTKCQCPLLPGCESLWGPLEFRSCVPVGEEEGEGKRRGCAPGRESLKAISFLCNIHKRAISSSTL